MPALDALSYYLRAALRFIGLGGTNAAHKIPKRAPLSEVAKALGVRRTRHGVVLPAGVEGHISTGEPSKEWLAANPERVAAALAQYRNRGLGYITEVTR